MKIEMLKNFFKHHNFFVCPSIFFNDGLLNFWKVRVYSDSTKPIKMVYSVSFFCRQRYYFSIFSEKKLKINGQFRQLRKNE